MMTREEAIKELKIEWLGEYDRQREAKNIAIEALKILEEQESLRKGKWIRVHHIEDKFTYDSWKCSECQHDFDSEEESMVNFDEYSYCPSCGIEMESER